jgi:uroporphyrinogen-III synthase
LIDFEAITPPSIDLANFDAVFLNSPQAARRFFEAYPDSQLPVAVLGEGTAKHAEKSADVAFIGQGAVEDALKQVKHWLDGRKVLIPRGAHSKRRLQQVLPEAQLEEVVLYHTHSKLIALPSCDVYVFTSPSNVRSFFDINQLPSSARVVAIGHTTAEQLGAYGVNARLATNYRPDGLWYAIFSAIHS